MPIERDRTGYRDPYPGYATRTGLQWTAPAPARGTVQPRTTAHRLIVGGAWVTLGVVVVSGVTLGWGPLGWLAGGSFSLPGMDAARTTEVTEAVASVEITSSTGDVGVRYEEVPNARILERDLPAGSVTHRVENGRLIVESQNTPGPRISLFTREQVTIVLPRAVQDATPDVTVRSTSGSIDLDGRFGTVDISAQSGSIDADGSYEALTARTTSGGIDVRASAGRTEAEATHGSINLRLEEVATVHATTESGSVDLDIRGSQPGEVVARTGAGSVDMTVPTGSYAVQTQTGSGSVDVDVPQDASATHRITAATGAGSIDIDD